MFELVQCSSLWEIKAVVVKGHAFLVIARCHSAEQELCMKIIFEMGRVPMGIGFTAVR